MIRQPEREQLNRSTSSRPSTPGNKTADNAPGSLPGWGSAVNLSHYPPQLTMIAAMRATTMLHSDLRYYHSTNWDIRQVQKRVFLSVLFQEAPH
jgi:hypothetical protein